MHSKITLGLPTYKGILHIKDSLDSILGQSFVDFKLIVSINGNDSETFKICSDYARMDSRVLILYHKTFLTVYENFYETLKLSESDLFMWVSDDDLLPKDYLKNIYDLFLYYDCRALVYGNFVEFENFPIPTNHKANHKIFAFAGSRTYRKLKYLLTDPGLGKVNSLYGLGRADWFHYAFNLNRNGIQNIYDVGFLYDILDVCDIRFSKNIHYRRKFVREIKKGAWNLSNLFFINDFNSFSSTIKNSSCKLRIISYVFLPYILLRSFVKKIYSYIK